MLGSRRALLVERWVEMSSVQDADPGTSSMGGQQARLLSLAGGRARRAKSGLVVDCEGEGDGTRNQRTRPPGGNDLVELGLGRSIGHKRVPKKAPRGDPLSTCSRRSLWNGRDRTVNNTSEAAVAGSLPFGGDAVEMGVDLESFGKRATAFGRFNASPECLGTHAHWRWATG